MVATLDRTAGTAREAENHDFQRLDGHRLESMRACDALYTIACEFSENNSGLALSEAERARRIAETAEKAAQIVDRETTLSRDQVVRVRTFLEQTVDLPNYNPVSRAHHAATMVKLLSSGDL